MRWLPEIESLVAILYGRIEGCKQIRKEEHIERSNRFHRKGGGGSARKSVLVGSLSEEVMRIYFILGALGGAPDGGGRFTTFGIAFGGILNSSVYIQKPNEKRARRKGKERRGGEERGGGDGEIYQVCF